MRYGGGIVWNFLVLDYMCLLFSLLFTFCTNFLIRNTLHLGNFIFCKQPSSVFFPLLVLVKSLLKALVDISINVQFPRSVMVERWICKLISVAKRCFLYILSTLHVFHGEDFHWHRCTAEYNWPTGVVWSKTID